MVVYIRGANLSWCLITLWSMIEAGTGGLMNWRSRPVHSAPRRVIASLISFSRIGVVDVDVVVVSEIQWRGWTDVSVCPRPT